ncbi:MAG: MDR family MFS transporter, partial [Anaerolineae bacterium]
MIPRLRSLISDFPRQFWVLFCGSLISATGGGLIFPFMTLYLRQKLDISMTTIGLLFGVMAVVGLLPQVMGGALADKLGRKAIMLVSLFGSGLATLGVGLATNMSLLLACLILDSTLGWPLYAPATNAMVADLVKEGKRTQAYGLLRVVHNLGIVIGPSVGGLIIAFGSYLHLFILAAITSLIFFLITLFFIRETKPETVVREEGAPLAGYGQVLQDQPFLAFCLVAILETIVYAQMTTTFPVFLKQERGIPEALWGLIMATNAGMVVLFQFPLTRLSDHYRRTAVLAVGALFYAVGFGGIGLGTGFFYFVFCVIVLTIGEMLFIPTATAYVADIAPEDMRGRYMGAAGLIWGAGFGIGPIVGGAIMDRWGGVYIWPVTFVLSLLGAAAFLALEWVRPVVPERPKEKVLFPIQ